MTELQVNRQSIFAASVEQAIITRRSVRGFLPQAVSREDVEHLLTVASRAPSGSDIQPWRVHVLMGSSLASFKNDLLRAFDAGQPESPESDYYPEVWRSPYLERRRRVGSALYELAGAKKADRQAAARQRARNYTFFDAPVGVIFCFDRDLGRGSWLDFGIFPQNIMIYARGHGLDTCPQASLADYPHIVRARLSISHSQLVICGMALGYADPTEPANQLVTEREELPVFTVFHA